LVTRPPRSAPSRPAALAALAALLALVLIPATASAGTGDPAANRSLSSATYSACSGDPSSGACVGSALADINAAHAAEGVAPMVLPSGFASMPVSVQLLNLANLERVDRGLAPILGLSAALNQDAQTAAAQDEDPLPTHFYGTAATSNWAGGLDSALEADFEWMYDDGLGSFNLDCTSSDQSGCWGHRHDILWAFSTPIAMGAAVATGQYGRSMTELFVGGDRDTGAGQPDAPVVTPSSSAPTAGTGPGSSRRTGHAAAAGHPWAGRITVSGPAIALKLGCTGQRGSVCTLKLSLTTGAPARAGLRLGSATVAVAAGHRTTVRLSLGSAARRLLAARHILSARLTVSRAAASGRVVLLARAVRFTSRD
jgi:hypothetical protein